jgi:hypothetical protein
MSDYIKDMFIEVREEPKKTDKNINVNTLVEMIEQTMNSLNAAHIKTAGYSLTEEEDVIDITGEDKDDEDVQTIRRPVIKITEAWGNPDNVDRQVMESLLSQIEGGTVEDKVQSVNNFVNNPPAELGGDISKIMSYLIFLDTFASIINDYGASVSGFLFEAFLAALFGGTSIQVDDPEQVGAKGSLPIEDNQLFMQLKAQSEDPDAEPNWDIVPYSLKVLRQDGVVHGSFKNLVDFFLDPAPQRKSDSVVYLVVIKEGQKSKEGKNVATGRLHFYEFELTRENFMQMIGAPTEVNVFGYVPVTLPRNVKQPNVGQYYFEKEDGRGSLRKAAAEFPYGSKDMPLYKYSEDQAPSPGERIAKGTEVLRLQVVGTEDVIKGTAEKLYTPEQHKDIMSKFGGAGEKAEIDRAAFAALKQTKGYGSKVAGGAQWSITKKEYKKGFKGTLDLNADKIEAKAVEYTRTLNQSLVNIFNALGDLTDNINSYFIAGDASQGLEAKTNATKLRDAVNDVIPEEAIEQKAAE